MPKSILLLIVATIFGLLLVACDNDATRDSTVDPPQISGPLDPVPPELPPNGNDGGHEESCTDASRVEWASAPQYVGIDIALVGPVSNVGTGNFAGTPGTVLTLGYPPSGAELVQVFIPERTKARFPDPFAEFNGKVVCALGVLQSAGGTITMVINEPTDITTI